MSMRYVHPSEDAVFTALERLGGHGIGNLGWEYEKAATFLNLRLSDPTDSKSGRDDWI